MSRRRASSLFSFYEIAPKKPIKNSEVVKRIGPLTDLYDDPDVAIIVQQMSERRKRVRDTHLREWAKAKESRSKRKKQSWDDRIPGESLEEYRLRLDAGDPKEIARDRERARKFKARVAARLAAQGRVVPCHKI